jgi:hypothetical protein
MAAMSKGEKTADNLIYLVMYVPSMCLRAWVVTKVWGWFASSFGLPGIDMIDALLAGLLFNLAFGDRKPEPVTGDDYPSTQLIINSIGKSVVGFILCWIVAKIGGR